MKEKVSLLLLSIFLMMSCQDTYIVKGTTDATSFKGRKIALKVLSDRGQWKSVDSCEVTHGTFLMKGQLDSVAFATLCVDDVPVMPIIIESGILHVDLSTISLHASGTRLNNELYSFFDKKNALQERVTELGHIESQMIMNGASADAVRHYVDSVYSVISDSLSTLVGGLDPVIRHYLTSLNP